MLALSLTQPWASLVATGAKKIETRSWRPNKSAIGQRIAIHASKGFPRDAKEICYEPVFFDALWPLLKRYRRDEPKPNGGYVPVNSGSELVSMADIDKVIEDMRRGVVLCTVKLRGAWSTNDEDKVERLSDQERAFGNYAPDRWMWVLEDVQLVTPFAPAKGSLGLWQWEPLPVLTGVA